MQVLRRYVQISDLHFGSPGARAAYDPWAQYVPLLDGFVGEDHASLVYLADMVARLRRRDPNLELIVTGDLTAYGAADQFSRAEQFLGTAGTAPKFLGLNIPHWKQLAVPGNHDHWPGIPFVSLGGNSVQVRSRFPATHVAPPVSLGSGRQLVFLHLDGDIDVKPKSPQRFFACGSFVSGLRDLRQSLAPARPDEVRVLLLHYSLEFRGRTIRSTWPPLSLNLRHLTIDDASRDELMDFMRDHRIRILLTGHVHHPYFVGDPGLPATAAPAMEGRCGSTTQRLAPFAANGAHASRRFKNSLIVHHVEEDPADGSLWWSSAVHVTHLSGGVGFQPAASVPITVPAPEHRLRVWP